LSKVKCFGCHKTGHYASQCPKKKKGKEKTQQVVESAETQMDEFVAKFGKDFSLISCLSTSTITRNAWYLDSGAFHHMKNARELFNSLMEKYSRSHVELGDDAKYTVEGEGTILFQLESGGSLEAQDVLYVPELKKNLLLVSALGERDFVVLFKKGQVLIRS
jgi:hypothetical protein